MINAKTLGKAFPIWVLAALALVALVYWPGLDGGFAFDDFQNIVKNPALRISSLDPHAWLSAALSSSASALQRPLAMLSFAANSYFTGLDPRPMKLTNVAIHLLNTVLVFGLARSLLGYFLERTNRAIDGATEKLALFTAVIWALSPINLMAVLLVVQRMESLSHTFVFLGLWLYVLGRIRQRRADGGWGLVLLGLIPCTAMGLLSKESAILLPLYAFGLELFVFHFKGAEDKQDRRMLALYAAVLFLPAIIAIAWLLPRALGAGAFSSRDFTLTERLLTEPRVVMDYLQWTLLPDLRQLSLFHDDYLPSRGVMSPPGTLVGLIGIPALLAIIWFLRRRRPLISLGLFWFLAAQVLTATIINLELVFEHRNYFASLGVMLVVVDILLLGPKAESARRLGAMAAGLFLFYCAGTTHLRAREWSDPVRFASTEAEKHPNSPRATYEFARMIVLATNYKSSSPFYGQAWDALERARQVPRSGVLPDQAALLFAARTGHPLKAAWWNDMRDKLRRDPIGPQEQLGLIALSNCAVEELCQFPEQDMLETFDAALSQGPDPGILSIYGKYALYVLGDPALALRLWQAACDGEPGNAQFRVNLAMLLIDLGRSEEAAKQIQLLRQTGRLGQFSGVAESLEARERAAAKRRSAPGT